MNCSKVQDLLSDYYDAEVSDDVRSEVAKHLSECSVCADRLAGFEKLSTVVGDWMTPLPPARVWAQIERGLDRHADENVASLPLPNETSRLRPVQSHFSVARLLTLAATVLVAAGIWWMGHRVWSGHGQQDEMTAVFGRYLDEFRHDPSAAQQFLLTKYDGQPVDAQQAAQRVGYRPTIAGGLPDGYAVESTYAMKMPCCNCVKCLCLRKDGSNIAIFEHDDRETTHWFGDRPVVSAKCGGKDCRVVQLDDHIAASWKHDDRHITVVGARDLAELNQIVAWFDERKRATLTSEGMP